MTKCWSSEEKDQLRDLWRSGKTVSEIAKLMNKSESAVKNQRRHLDLPPRRSGNLTVKTRVGVAQDTYELLRRKAVREGQTVPRRIRTLIEKDLMEP